jgi:hypothetical protein
MRDILTASQQAFHRYHPDTTFDDSLYGSGTGIAGIITSTSDLALMGPVIPNEVIGFEWVSATSRFRSRSSREASRSRTTPLPLPSSSQPEIPSAPSPRGS